MGVMKCWVNPQGGKRLRHTDHYHYRGPFRPHVRTSPGLHSGGRAALRRSDCRGAEPGMEGALRIRQWRRKTRPPSARRACERFLPGHTAKLPLLNTNKETKYPPAPPKKIPKKPPALLNVYEQAPVR